MAHPRLKVIVPSTLLSIALLFVAFRQLGESAGPAPSTEGRTRVLVVGLDGFTWDLARPWMNEGRMPNLQRLTEEGTWSALETVRPASSPPAWTSAVTGVNPGKHGIFGFLHTLPDGSKPTFVSSAQRRYVPIWKLLSSAGRRVAIINVPASSPPDPVNGIMVGGFPHPSHDAIAWPADTLADFPDYRSDNFADEPAPGQEDVWLLALRATESARLRLALSQLGKGGWDLFFVVFTGPDRISHHFWHHMDPLHPRHDPELARRYGGAIRDFYSTMDASLGELLRAAGRDVVTMVLSDHGFGPAYRALSGARLMSALNPDLEEGRRPPVYLHDHFCGQVRIAAEPGVVTDAAVRARYEDRREQAIRVLKGLRDPADGRPLLAEIHRREEIYHGEALGYAPDLVYRESPGYLVLDTGPEAELVAPMPHHAFSGFHRSNGILVLHGPAIEPGAPLATASILDVTPTLLHLLGEPVPGHMDGRVLTEALAPGRWRGHGVRTVKLTESEYHDAHGRNPGGGAEIEQQLRALGYLR